jgi:hypothetical protein
MEQTRKAIGIKTIEIDGVEYAIKPKIGQVTEYLENLNNFKAGKNVNIIDIQVSFVASLLLQGGNGLTDDEARLLVETNLKDAIYNTHVALKLIDEKDLQEEEERLKKKQN